MQNRKNALNKWLEHVLEGGNFSLSPLAGDASFRQYYRLQYNEHNRIVMDAPTEQEAILPFLAINAFLRANGLRSPQLYAVDDKQGFAILEDFGDGLLLSKLTVETAEPLYKLAIQALLTLQECPTQSSYEFPIFDKACIARELNIFIEWFLQGYLKLNLEADRVMLAECLDWLGDELSKQPKVLMHRDFHSRNLMVLDDPLDSRLGIIDFQDATIGPFTYDLVSILKDCYIQWPRHQVMHWLSLFYEQSPVAKQWPLDSFIRGFELCGLQRHLKVLGIFSRLHLRDNKPNYLSSLPLIHHYVLDCLEAFEELSPLYQFMQRIQLP